MKNEIKKQLRKAGFKGSVYFRKQTEFGTPDTFGPAIHRRWIDPQHEIEEILYDADRDGFDTVVIYLEPASYYRYRQLLTKKSHIWTKSEIDGLRKQMGYCSGCSQPARDELIRDCGTFDFKITREQTAFGLQWLRETQFKKSGELRAGAFIGRHEAKIIKTFKEFRFVGIHFENFNQWSQCWQTISPVYAVISKDGSSFEYAAHAFNGCHVLSTFIKAV